MASECFLIRGRSQMVARLEGEGHEIVTFRDKRVRRNLTSHILVKIKALIFEAD